ncbi:hypothetical protein [uncultured Friedmanniella sp.]|uniref:hypothetical protein n=1 Tax=uncultured Friedmanniella sp. TaxID=335381 RepID=UPI0035CA6449
MINLDAARTFVHSHARLIDRRRFQHAFDDAPAELVVTALAAYRNPDGGFGALEPDLRTPASQPIPLRYAMDVLATVPSTGETRALGLGALDWLSTVTNDDGGVPFVLPGADEQPAAPWMRATPESSLLATAQLLAGATRLGLDHPWLERAGEYCWARIDDVSPGDAYTFKYVVDLLDVVPDRDRADQQLQRLADLVPADGRLGVEEGAPGEELDPLALAPSPDHAGTRLLGAAALERALDHLEGGQRGDGGWDFTWTKWNPAAAWEWRGVVTVEALLTLQSHRGLRLG